MARPKDARGPDDRWEEVPFSPLALPPANRELIELELEAWREGNTELLRELGVLPPEGEDT